MKQIKAILKQKELLTQDVLFAKFEAIDKFSFIPGQFITIPIGSLKRFYSFATTPLSLPEFELIATVEKQGVGSYFLQNQVRIGQEISLFVPQGKFNLQNTSKPKIFLATGVGISAIRSMIQTLVKTHFQNKFLLFFGLRTKKDIFLEREWQNIQNINHNFSYYYCLSREKTENYKFGYVSENLKQYLNLKNLSSGGFEYYVCGNLHNVQVIIEFLQKELNINSSQIFFEKFV